MRRYIAFFKLSLPILLYMLPVIVLAATGVVDGHAGSGLVPCGASDNPMIATECQGCDFVQLIQNVINFLIILSIPIAAMLFAYAGAKLVTSGGRVGAREEAKKIVTRTAIGFVLVLGSWTIVNTLIFTLVAPNYFQSSWFHLECTQNRNRSATFGNALLQGTGGLTAGGNTSNGGGGGSQAPVQASMNLNIQTPGGNQNVPLNTTRTNGDLTSTFTKVRASYENQIDQACAQFGSNIPDCSRTVSSLIVVESSGSNANLMQVNSNNGGSSCSSGDSACNINAGVKYLSTLNCNSLGTANCIAAYNGGPSTAPGSSPSGKNPAMANSNDCPGYYAWQCATNAGGLSVTRQEVANVCQTIQLEGGSC